MSRKIPFIITELVIVTLVSSLGGHQDLADVTDVELVVVVELEVHADVLERAAHLLLEAQDGAALDAGHGGADKSEERELGAGGVHAVLDVDGLQAQDHVLDLVGAEGAAEARKVVGALRAGGPVVLLVGEAEPVDGGAVGLDVLVLLS